MPTTLQQQQTKPEPHYMAQATAPSQKVSSAIPAQTLLDSHVIEPELRQGFPRQVTRPREVPWRNYLLLALGLIFPLLPLFTHVHNAPSLAIFFVGVYAIVAFVFYWDDFQQPHRDRLLTEVLRYGAAAPALIYDVHWVGDYIHVHYICRDQFGEIQSGVLKMNWEDVQRHDLKAGDTFTVIISREDGRLFPYFHFSDYRVEPMAATIVSYQVTDTLRTQTLLAPKQSLGMLGSIEPELVCLAPRKVEYLRQSTWLWRGGLTIATLLTVASFFPAAAKAIYQTYGFVFLIALNVYNIYSLFTKRYQRNILAKLGIPARAMVTHIDYGNQQHDSQPLKETIPVTYQYEARDHKVYKQTVYIARGVVWREGIVEGTTFTVLYHPMSPADAYPYFLLPDSRIVGATTVKVTPP